MKSVTLLILASFFAFSCASSNTSMTTAWKNDKVKKENYNTIFIAAITPNMEYRTTLENELAFQAKQRGIKAVQSNNVIPGALMKGNMLSREQLSSIIKENKADAVFIVTVQDQQAETHYVPGMNTFYDPMSYGYYGNYYGYYSTVYAVSYDPGYYTTERTYYLETNIYDVESEGLIWSGQSTTYNPIDAEDFTKGYVQTILQQLIKDKIVKPEAKKEK